MIVQILERFHIHRNLRLLHFADIIINHMNIRRNDMVLVHTSLHNFKRSDFQPEDLIYLLKMIIGTEGTLLMPIPGNINPTKINTQPQHIKGNSLSSIDQITDTFLHMEDTVIVKFPGYTLAAWGKDANFMTETNRNPALNHDNENLSTKLNQLKTKFIGFGNNESFEFLMEHFKENEIRTLTKRGISYFWLCS